MGTSQRTKFALSAISPSKPDSTAIVTSEEFMRYLPQEAWPFLLNTLNVISVVTRARKNCFLLVTCVKNTVPRQRKGVRRQILRGKPKGRKILRRRWRKIMMGKGRKIVMGKGRKMVMGKGRKILRWK